MKIMTSLALLAAFVGCEKTSALDSVTAGGKSAAHATESTAKGSVSPPPVAAKGGSVEDRLARLEAIEERNAEALDFLNKVYAQQKQQQEQAQRSEPAEDAMFAVNVADDIKAGQVDGPANAPVTIIKAFDFACPYCQRVSGTMEELVKEYNGKVRVVYANLLIHDQAKPAHLASCAAAKQGKYMAFKDAFWQKGFLAGKLDEETIMAIAKDLGLNTDKLKSDMTSAECIARLDNDKQELVKFGVGSTPTFFINGKVLSGAQPKAAFKKIIDEQLEIVEKSGVPAGQYYDKVVLATGEKQFRSKMDPKRN